MIEHPTLCRALALLLVLLLAPAAEAADWVVKPDGTGDFATIQDAVDAAASGDRILLADGTFNGARNRSVDYLGKELTIRSQSGNRYACVIDCEDVAGSGIRFLSGEGSGAVLQDLSLIHCASPAIDMLSASPVVRNVVVRDGTAPMMSVHEGAPVLTGCVWEANTTVTSAVNGITMYSAAATVENCRFRSNGLGGAVIFFRGGTVDVRGCTFEENWSRGITVARDWGGLDPDPDGVIESCSFERNRLGVSVVTVGVPGLEIRDCTVSGTLAYGMQLWAGSGVITVQGCTVSGNEGNGIEIYALTGSDPVIEDCTVQGNGGAGVRLGGTATPVVRRSLITGNGNGIASWSPSLVIEGSTLAFNDRGPHPGGGVYFAGTNLDVRESIVWGNCSQGGKQISTGSASITQLTCSIVESLALLGSGTFHLSDVLEADPLFCSPTDCASAPITGGVWGVAETSPALSHACGTMGYTQSTCTAVSVQSALTPATWGWIKAAYR